MHVWLVLRHGVSEPPKAGRPVDPRTYRAWYHETMQREGVPFFPDSAWRDALFAVGLVLVVVALAILVSAPELGKPPDPSLLASAPRPDWYLLWMFSLFALLPPSWENYFIVIGPALAVIVLFLIPLWNRGERSPARRPWAIASVFAICLMVGALWIAGIKSPWSPDFAAQPLPQKVVGATAGPVVVGAHLFYNKGCEFCHAIAGQGGQRGPDLTTVGDRLTPAEMTWRILTGGTNMPAFAGNLTPEQIDALIAFLKSRTAQR